MERALKKHGKQAIGKSCGGWNTKLHMVSASDREAVLLATLGGTTREVYLLMDKAYEGDATRGLSIKIGYIPFIPPKSNRKILGNTINPFIDSTIKPSVFCITSRARPHE